MAEATTDPSVALPVGDPKPTATAKMKEDEDSEPQTNRQSGGQSVGATTDDEPTKAARKLKLIAARTGGSDGDDNAPGRLVDESGTSIPPPLTSSTQPMMRPVSPPNLDTLEPGRRSVSPHRARQSHTTSPGLPIQPSPRMHSPASSQIFERNVQEDIVPAQASPSIPSHIKTENHIPPILDASSATITDDRLDPDAVEIITHSSHHLVANTQNDHAVMHGSWHEHEDAVLSAPIEAEDSVSNYGALDSADIKRLSFVSFADLLHGEHAEITDVTPNPNATQSSGGGPNLNPGHLGARNRSPSPVHSPTSSHGLGTSPPTSMSSPLRANETSPHGAIRAPSSPGLSGCSPPPSVVGGELNVETMRQALRRTESGDLGGYRSQPMSAVGTGDNTLDRERLFK